ncbi:MAG: ComEC/Rec2 family competence protein [Actinomycetia bacterium]|nr:ComEC/Rec2 family competence protein [Actinomycetes bacterium]
MAEPVPLRQPAEPFAPADRWVLAGAVVTVAALLLPHDLSLWWPGLTTVVAVRARWRWLLLVALALVGSTMAARADDGLSPVAAGHLDAVVTLVSDPEWFGPALRADVSHDGARLEAWFRGQAARTVAGLLAGEQIRIEGAVRPRDAAKAWLEVRHIRGSVSVTVADRVGPGSLPSRLANGLRRTIASGLGSFDRDRAALVTGLIYGDDRGQDPVTADRFRAAGLTHLLAVSGSNVLFVLALAAPVVAVWPRPARLVGLMVVLAFFALVTRYEPSVLRATTMAGLALIGHHSGRSVSSPRLLALAFIGLVLIDPLLIRNVGFQLSVAASVGILALAGPIVARIPGPRWFAEAGGVTVAAQVGVLPIQLAVFGGLPLASLPANIAAVPVAGPVMVWGLTAGLVAGVVGGGMADLIHLPTGLAVDWLLGVAEVVGGLSTAQLRWWHVPVVATVSAAVVVWPRALVVGGLVTCVVVIGIGNSTPPVHEVGSGVTVHRDGAVVLVVDPGGIGSTGRLLEELRNAGVGDADLLVLRRGGRSALEALSVLRDSREVRLVVAPRGSGASQSWLIDEPVELVVGGLEVEIVPGPDGSLDVEVRRIGPDG